MNVNIIENWKTHWMQKYFLFAFAINDPNKLMPVTRVVNKKKIEVKSVVKHKVYLYYEQHKNELSNIAAVE